MAGVRARGVGLLLCACRFAEPIELPPAPPAAADSSVGTLEILDPLPGIEVQSLALGLEYSCALSVGGAVVCWGSHDYGVLGPSQQDVSDPSRVAPFDFGSERAVVQVSAGWHHVCVLFEDERARCWGRNDYGQLGQGHTEDYGDDSGETLNALPDIPLEGVIRISAGVSNTCAVIRASAGVAGTVHCWGSDERGAIGDALSGTFGDDEPVDASRAVQLPELAVDVAAGDHVNCARLAGANAGDGSLSSAVHCWGGNQFGTLGIGDTSCNIGDEQLCEGGLRIDRADRQVQGLNARVVAALHLNQAHACVIDEEGELMCWGRNDQSRAGYPHAVYGTELDGTPGPVLLGSGPVVSVALGTRHGCALEAQGGVRCWGEAGPQLGYGMAQLDDVAGIGGTEEPSAQYELMGTTRGIVQLGDTDGLVGNDLALRVYAGGHHNCVILASGAVRCWGSNARGELGYGDFSGVGNIGDEGSPAAAYEQLGRYDVCVGFAGAVTTPCAN